MTPVAILMQVRSDLSDPRRWTIRALARNAEGHPVTCNSAKAVCWCLAAAISRRTEHSLAVRVICKNELTREIGSIAFWNDHRHHSEVIAMLDAVIARLVAQPREECS